MRSVDIKAAVGTALLLLSSPCAATHGHGLSHLDILGKRHSHNHKRIYASHLVEDVEVGLEKRGTCAFPTNAGLVPVTPGSSNAGWAMSPDQPCTPGSYCPYACPPGQVMAQWNPAATSYTYPLSMDGGLYCNFNGHISKPFPLLPYCVDGTGTVGAQNNAGDVVSFCQTVLPGNEAMLIPTQVDSWSQLAVPDTSYWCSTAAHYYINPPGVGTDEACVWSDGSKPIGNWSPYVAGANTDAHGNTFVKIGWNPIWTSSSLSGSPPNFGVKIVCTGSGCNGTPCSIDPSTNGIGGVNSADQATGAGGANFCVVTVPRGETANIVVFPAGNPEGGSDAKPSHTKAALAAPPKPTSAPSTSSSAKSLTSAARTTSTSTTSSDAAIITPQAFAGVNTTIPYPTAENSPHILFENQTTTAVVASPTVSADSGNVTVASPAATSKKSAAAGTTISNTVLLASALFAITYLL